MFSKIIHLINRKFGTSLESKTVLGCILVLVFLAFLWWKYEQAKRRIVQERIVRYNRNRNRDRNRNNANNNNPNANANLGGLEVNELRQLSAKTRYLESDSWMDQSICVCLDQLCDKKLLSAEYKFVLLDECVSMLKDLVNRHRVHIIHCIPFAIQTQQISDDSDTAFSEPTPYEKEVVNQFKTHGIIGDRFPEYKLLFCVTKKGKASMVRQLSPTLYMDSDEWVLKELYMHLTEVVQITDFLAGGGISSTVFVANDFLSYFQ